MHTNIRLLKSARTINPGVKATEVIPERDEETSSLMRVDAT
jgi:hypothetical protein